MSALDATMRALEWAWPLAVILGTAVLFLVGCRVVWRIADRHREAEPRGRSKVAVAIVLSLVAGGAAYALILGVPAAGVEGAHPAAREGMHDSLIKNLNSTLGEAKYLEAAQTMARRPATIAAAEGRLLEANATLAKAEPGSANHTRDLAARNVVWASLNQSRTDLRDATILARQLTPNHRTWLLVEPLLREHRDDEAERIVRMTVDKATVAEVLGSPANPMGVTDPDAFPCVRDGQGHCKTPFEPKAVESMYYMDHHGHPVPYSVQGPRVFEAQREFNHQMDTQFAWFVLPGLTGIFLAPFAFVGGHILGKAYAASTTVGYKRYPGKAAGFFLLCMAGFVFITAWLNTPPMLDLFGIFAIPFAAVVLRDLHKRSVEGQIAL